MKKLIVFLIFTACSSGLIDIEQEAKRRPDAPPPPPPADAPAANAPGWASCWTSPVPDAACNLTTQFCCFDEIDAPHYGWCTDWNATGSAACLRSWNYCDGNEDCPTGTMCTAHHQDSAFYPGVIFAIECRASLPAGDKQLCHPGDGTCPAGTTCLLGQSPEVGWYGLSPKIYLCN